MASHALQKVLTTPSKIASALDWKRLNGAVLALNIHSDRISLAVASHPSYGKRTEAVTTAVPLNDLPLGRKGKVTAETQQQLQNLLKEYRVCGIIVAWPVQTDTGRMGASCGRVLHTLDQLLNVADSTTSSSTTATTTTGTSITRRPLCLWDAGDHSMTPPPPDPWGRSPAYAPAGLRNNGMDNNNNNNNNNNSNTVHRASVEQYHTDEAITVTQVWNDFCKAHWPELCQQQLQQQQLPTSRTNVKKSRSRNDAEEAAHASHWDHHASHVKMAAH